MKSDRDKSSDSLAERLKLLQVPTARPTNNRRMKIGRPHYIYEDEPYERGKHMAWFIAGLIIGCVMTWMVIHYDG